MGQSIGKNRAARIAYGFDDVSLVPGNQTLNPLEVNTSFSIQNDNGTSIDFDIPIIASPMDGISDARFCTEMGRLGGLSVLNLDGIQTRYQNPGAIIEQIVCKSDDKITAALQKIYTEPVKVELITKRIKELKDAGIRVAVSALPQKAERYMEYLVEAGADILVIQDTVISANHVSSQYQPFNIGKICSKSPLPVIVGNTVNYDVAYQLMEAGAAGILVGVGPGAASTSNCVLGLNIPQITATIDCSAAREDFFKKYSKYIPIITDGGMKSGGDICKALAAGADAVMLGSAFASATEAAGKGHYWGMVTPNIYLPRNKRVNVGLGGALKSILYGPSTVDDGSDNLVGALTSCMGLVGAKSIKEFHKTEIIISQNT